MAFNLSRNLQSSTSFANIEKLHPSLFPSHSLLFGYEAKKISVANIKSVKNKSQMSKPHSLINLKNKQGINELESLLQSGIARPSWN